MKTFNATITINNELTESKINTTLSASLFRSKRFQKLSKTAQAFYILCMLHKQEDTQKSVLHDALNYYWARDDQDNLFVLTQNQLSEYGYSSQLANKYKKELIQNGFIKVAYQDKAHMVNSDWARTPTVYQFVDDWKCGNG